MLTNAWVSINVLRRVLGCSLPIQLWHIGPRELGPVEASLLRPLDVEIVDALRQDGGATMRTLGGWELKAQALALSRFEQVLLLDADNVPVSDPSVLFDAPQLAETGALVWPDLPELSAENPIWELCGVDYRSEASWESGQMVVDKSRCWPALQVALHMNAHSEVFYPYTHGDKDVFHLAWIVTGTPWSMPGHAAKGTPTGLVQRDFEGRLLFQHRTTAKWSLMGHNPVAEEFRHQGECVAFIDELRERWSGRIWAAPVGASDHDAAVEASIKGVGWHALNRAGDPPRLVELLDGNRVGVGAIRDRLLRWYVRGGVLTLDGADTTLARLVADGERWVDGTFELAPTPQAGRDALGQVATVLLEQVAEHTAGAEDDVVTTLAILAQVGDLEPAFDRALSRWWDDQTVLRVVDRARRRVGLRDPSLGYHALPGYEPGD